MWWLPQSWLLESSDSLLQSRWGLVGLRCVSCPVGTEGDPLCCRGAPDRGAVWGLEPGAGFPRMWPVHAVPRSCRRRLLCAFLRVELLQPVRSLLRAQCGPFPLSLLSLFLPSLSLSLLRPPSLSLCASSTSISVSVCLSVSLSHSFPFYSLFFGLFVSLYL